jgi:hypothetical protein
VWVTTRWLGDAFSRCGLELLGGCILGRGGGGDAWSSSGVAGALIYSRPGLRTDLSVLNGGVDLANVL